MYIAIVLQVPKSAPSQAPTVTISFIGETAQAAAQLADAQAEHYNISNSGYKYSVLVGEMTHEVKQPERRVVLTPLSK
jgi:hypothetical protein